jgi:hypothetical protein
LADSEVHKHNQDVKDQPRAQQHRPAEAAVFKQLYTLLGDCQLDEEQPLQAAAAEVGQRCDDRSQLAFGSSVSISTALA